MSGLKTLSEELKNASKETYSLITDITDELSFVEYDRFLRSETALGDAVGEGVVSGFATINDINVAVFAINGDVLKGGIGAKNSDKIVKCVNRAVKTGSPLVAVFDTGGARFSEGISAMDGYSKIIKAFADARETVTVISVIKGNNFGLSSYLTFFSDICIGYEKSCLCTFSPLVLSAKANTDIKNVGSASAHSKTSGIYSLVVKNNKELKTEIVKFLDLTGKAIIESADDGNRVSKLLKQGVKSDVLISEIFDKDTFFALKKDFAPEVVTGLARLNGIAVGVMVNNSEINGGRLNNNSCSKINSLLEACHSFNLPLISLVDCKGSVQSLEEENSGLIESAGKLLYRYNQLETAKISLIVGNAVGLGYTAFASKSAIDCVLAWENANLSLIDALSAAELLYSDEIAKSKNKEAAAKKLAESYSLENTSAITVCKDGYLDNVIEPAFSRQYLIAALGSFLK